MSVDDNGTFAITVNMGIVLARQVKNEAYRKSKVTMQLTQKVTISELIEQLGIPEDYISFITVNGEKCHWDRMIKPNDEIILFPYITGG